MLTLWLSSYLIGGGPHRYEPDPWWVFPTGVTALVIGLVEAAFELKILMWVLFR